MDTYAIWVDLVDSSQDLVFAEAISEYLGALREAGTIENYRLERRKFGFGPESLGEFHVRIEVKNLTQLDAAFSRVAARAEPLESLHANVFRRVKNFRSGLYRDFPDPVRVSE